MAILEGKIIFINPSAENFPSPGLAQQAQPLPYAAFPNQYHGALNWNPVTEMGTAANAAALTKWKMSEGGTSVVSHPQRDENHSEYDELFQMLIDEDAPMKFSLGNFDLIGSWNYAEHSEVQELQKGKEMMWAERNDCHHLDVGIQSPGGMVVSSPRTNSSLPRPESNDDHDSFNIEDLLRDGLDVGIESPGGMVVSSPRTNSSNDSLGSFDPDRLWGDNEYSVVEKLQNWQTLKPCSGCFTLSLCKPRQPCVPAFLLHLEWLCQNMVVEVGNGEELMRISVRKAYLEVDFASEENYPVCFSSQEAEPECWWGEMTERNLVSRRYAFCSKTHCWNVILELLGVAVRVVLYLGIKNYTFGMSTKGDGCTKMQKLVCLGRTFLNYVQMPHLHILQRLFLCHLERCALEGVAKLLNRKEIKVRYLEYGTAPSRMNHTAVGMLPPGLESSYECRIPATNDVRNRSKEKGTTCGRQQKYSGITLQAIEQVLNKTRDVAAQTLNVSPSTLKRACRKFGIPKWPIQKRKRGNCPPNPKQAAKKRKGSQHALPPPEQAATPTLQGNSTMSIKVTYKNNTVRFALSSSSTMKYLEEQLETRFKITLDNFFIKYQDEEDEWITLMCDSDLRYCMDVLSSSAKLVIRMMLTPKSD